jgi:hypothetical protein
MTRRAEIIYYNIDQISICSVDYKIYFWQRVDKEEEKQIQNLAMEALRIAHYSKLQAEKNVKIENIIEEAEMKAPEEEEEEIDSLLMMFGVWLIIFGIKYPEILESVAEKVLWTIECICLFLEFVWEVLKTCAEIVLCLYRTILFIAEVIGYILYGIEQVLLCLYRTIEVIVEVIAYILYAIEQVFYAFYYIYRIIMSIFETLELIFLWILAFVNFFVENVFG